MYRDVRLGGKGRWTTRKPEDIHLRLPDYVKDCVCFLCVEKDGVTLYGGTAFFVILVSAAHPEISSSYLVTAKHCVVSAYRDYGHLKARINHQDARVDAVLVDIKEEDWVYPDDPGVDVAVMAAHVPRGLQVFCMEMDSFLGQKYSEGFGVGIGDETTTVGLFTERFGKNVNIPILRSGIIAAMPEEEIYDSRTGAKFHAYLIEVRSIGGLSGSPVLVSIPPHRCVGIDNERPYDGVSVPLGLIRGHWNVHASEHDFADGFVRPEQINSGIAMVTPIQEVTKLIMENQKLKNMRAKMEQAIISGQLMIEDSSFGASSKEAIPFTKSDFEAALKKVSRKIEPTKS